MYASTAGGGAMSLVFKSEDPHKKGSITSVKLPDLKQPIKERKFKKAK